MKKLVEGHEGAVGVKSEVGHGSTFGFVLPKAGADLDTAADGASSEWPLDARH